MYRPAFVPYRRHSPRRQEIWARLLAPLAIWICVSVGIRFGYFGDSRMVLGPSSSRLVKASSLFVEHVEVRNSPSRGVLLYAFSAKPELKLETNWTVSNYLIVASYSRKGFSLWLNRGSRIRVKWEAQTSTLSQLQVVIYKGERKHEMLTPNSTSSSDPVSLTEPIAGKEAGYGVEEDDKYYIGVVNTSPKSIIMKITVEVSSKIYDVSQANSMCSAVEGSCQLGLQFPSIKYVVVATPNVGDIDGWDVELSFVARVVTYIAILGFIVVVIYLILKYLGACEGNTTTMVDTTPREVRETDPIIPSKSIHLSYGTRDEDEESGASSSSSEELYDEKLCVICYDEQRNCFFVPCGHCATCYDCAQRITEAENKVCPICRRLVHKVRRLFTS